MEHGKEMKMEIEMAKIEKFRLEKAIEQNYQKWYRLEIFREDTFESLEGANKFWWRLNEQNGMEMGIEIEMAEI